MKITKVFKGRSYLKIASVNGKSVKWFLTKKEFKQLKNVRRK